MEQKKNQITRLGFLLAVLFLMAYVIYGVISNYSADDKNEKLGILAVQTLYQFQNLNELDAKMDVLKSISTEEVYNQLTIDTTERSLRVYLKFKNKPSIVEIVKSSPGLVIYHLNSEAIKKERIFMFSYTVKKGKLSTAYEGEVIPFTTSK